MFSVIVIIFQAIALLFLGIFARTIDINTTTFSSYSQLVGDGFILMLAFTFMYSPFRKLSITSFALLLVTIGVTVQTELLFDVFWSSCFSGFSSSFTVNPELLMQTTFACLTVLITVLDFMGLFKYWQIYFLIAPTMTIGYSLVHNIINLGLKTFDGGGGMTVFLYSGVCSLMIWAVCIRGKVDYDKLRIKQSYVNQTLSLVGVMIAFANWPKFNMAGAASTSIKVGFVNTTAISATLLQNSALANTFLGLSAAILTSILFASKDTKEDKMKFKVYIDCFINGGIVIASYQDIALNPAVCIIMACFTTIITLIVHKYFLTQSQSSSESTFKNIMKNYSKIVFRVIFGILGSIIASIVVATRNGISPQLLVSDYSRTAGLQLVGFILTILFGAIFGLISAAFIYLFLKSRASEEQNKQEEANKVNEQVITDLSFFQGFKDDAHPLYYDIFEQINQKQEEKINIHDYTTKVIRQSLLGAQQNPLRMISVTKPFETKVDPNQAARPQNDFSKKNDFGRDVSQMKVANKLDSQSERQNESAVKPNQSISAQKSKLKIAESQSIPREQKPKNVARKLFQDDEAGSEIKNEKVTERPFLR